MIRCKILLTILLFLFTASCATLGGKQEFSYKQQSVIWMSLYNQQYKDVQYTLTVGKLNDERKDFILKKLKILAELKPLLDDYDKIAWSGGTPTEQMVMAINYLVYKLTDAIVGGV